VEAAEAEVEEEEAAEVEAVEEAAEAAEEEGVGTHPNLNKSSSLARIKESWDNSPKYLKATAPKPKHLWKKSKDTSASTPMSMDLTPP
jgi:hypothetical protein